MSQRGIGAILLSHKPIDGFGPGNDDPQQENF